MTGKERRRTDTRKIQSVGGGTYTVSLPKEWALSEGLEAGDVVNLHRHIDGLLVIQPQEVGDEVPEQVTARVADDDAASLRPTLRAAYAAGTTAVTLRAETEFTAEQRRAVQETAMNLAGASISDESESSITVRTLLDPAEVSVRQSVRQLTYAALSMHRDATAVATGGASAERLTGRDDQVDRLYALVERSFVRGLARLDEVDALGVTRPELFELWLTARELERVADHAERLGAVAAAVRERTDFDESATGDRERIGAAAEAARGILSDAVDVVVGHAEAETARRVLRDRDRFREEFSLGDGGTDGPPATVRRVSESPVTEPTGVDVRWIPVVERVRRTAEHGGNVAELGFQAAIRRGELAGDSPPPSAAADVPAEGRASVSDDEGPR